MPALALQSAARRPSRGRRVFHQPPDRQHFSGWTKPAKWMTDTRTQARFIVTKPDKLTRTGLRDNSHV